MLAVTILGNNSALPAYGRHPTAQILTMKEQLMLIDCGEGTQMQLSRYKIRISKINYIFISHMHGDHYFVLIGFLTIPRSVADNTRSRRPGACNEVVA